MIQRVAIYCRVSTADQSCERQERDLKEFAEKRGYQVIQIFKETSSGAKNDRAQRKALLALAKSREIDAILITELSRWGRSLVDLVTTMEDLESWRVSLVAMSGNDFDMSTASGKAMVRMIGVMAEFERELIKERVKSGLANARAKGKILGRRIGQNPSDKYKSRVLKHIADGRSYRWIEHEMQISKTTVNAIVKRHRAKALEASSH